METGASSRSVKIEDFPAPRRLVPVTVKRDKSTQSCYICAKVKALVVVLALSTAKLGMMQYCELKSMPQGSEYASSSTTLVYVKLPDRKSVV